jgi:hypothetical protein
MCTKAKVAKNTGGHKADKKVLRTLRETKKQDGMSSKSYPNTRKVQPLAKPLHN